MTDSNLVDRLVRCGGPKYGSIFQTILWLMRPTKFLERCQNRYGSTFRIAMFAWADFIMVSDPKVAKEIFLDKNTRLSASLGNEIMVPVVGTESIFVLEGREHLELRKALRPGLSAESMGAQVGTLESILQDSLPAAGSRRIPDLALEFRTITARILVSLLFGYDDKKRAEAFLDCLGPATGNLSSIMAFVPVLQKDFGFMSPIRYINKHLAKLDTLSYDAIEEARRRQNGGGIVEDLLAYQAEKGLSTKFVRDQLVSLLVAGVEVTAAVLAWGVYWIYADPNRAGQIRSRVLAEQDAGEPKSGRGSASYIDALCNEILRVIPAIDFVPRAVIDDGSRQTMVCACSHLIHQNKAIYEQPNQFVPERFLDRKYKPYEFLPFGGGVRRCAGVHVAKFILKQTLLYLMKHNDIEITNSASVRPKRRLIMVTPSKLDTKITARKE